MKAGMHIMKKPVKEGISTIVSVFPHLRATVTMRRMCDDRLDNISMVFYLAWVSLMYQLGDVWGASTRRHGRLPV